MKQRLFKKSYGQQDMYSHEGTKPIGMPITADINGKNCITIIYFMQQDHNGLLNHSVSSFFTCTLDISSGNGLRAHTRFLYELSQPMVSSIQGYGTTYAF